MKLAVIGYIPPPREPFKPNSFLSSLALWKPGSELILFSDHPWQERTIQIPPPEQFVTPGARLPNGQPNTWALNNLLFFTACRIADRQKVTHLLYIESDCRFGTMGWDMHIFDEFFSTPRHLICGGSVVCYNPCNSGIEAQRRWLDFLNTRNTRRNYPIPTYGFKGSSDASGSSVFVNGALGVYDVTWMKHFFPTVFPSDKGKGDSRSIAENMFAWDFAIGQKIWERFGPDSYDLVAHLGTVFSSYGDVLTTEEDRLAMLRKGKVVAIHQVKSGNV